MKWHEMPLVVVDFETTGFRPPRRIVEIGAVRFEGGREVDRLELLVRPGRSIEPGAVKVHGITDEDVASQPCFRERYPAFTDFMRGAAPVSYGGFDRRMLHEELDRLREAGHHVDEQVPAYSRAWERWIDVLGWVRELYPGRGKGRHTLANMAKAHDVELDRAHRAIDDALAAARVLWAVREQLPDVSLSELLHHRVDGG